MKSLYTQWGENLKEQMKKNPEEMRVLEEYPRPGMLRDSYFNLNGWWDYAITPKKSNDDLINLFDGKILVPFSPEAALSGLERQLLPEEFLWYRKEIAFDPEKIERGMRLILHFGAVDQEARIYVDGKKATYHLGGYLPFSVDLTPFAKEAASHTLEIIIRVSDVSDTSYHARGKQKLKRGGMYYTAQSGIWQTVWMEYLPPLSILDVTCNSDIDSGQVAFLVSLQDADDNCIEKSDNTENNQTKERIPVKIKIYAASDSSPSVTDPGQKIQELQGKEPILAFCDELDIVKKTQNIGRCLENSENKDFSFSPDEPEGNIYCLKECLLQIPKEKLHLWSCDHPYLYDYLIQVGEGDVVCGYFALRSFSKGMDKNGIPRILLNHESIFMEGVLDQGYWPDGLLTPPSDEAYVFDIMGMKRTGFSMIRKHIKIEADRFYYHCDRLGMIVWQDMVNGGSPYVDWYVTYLATAYSFLQIKAKDTHRRLLSRRDAAGREEWKREMLATISLLKKHPCISTWVIFNEGWGQFSTKEMVRLAMEADDSRFIDAASGWYDQGCGDMNSFHNYFFPLVIPREKNGAKRLAVLSEYGGYSYGIADHSTTEDVYGYGTYSDTASLNEAYQKRRHEMLDLIPKGLCASVYTQVSDIEDEVNGIYTYDRKIKKIDDVQK